MRIANAVVTPLVFGDLAWCLMGANSTVATIRR